MNIVVDTNIFISALIREGICREVLTNFDHNFLFPDFEFIEVNKHKDEIMQKAGLSEIAFNTLFLRLLKYVRIVDSYLIGPYREEAKNIRGEIDDDDSVFIATALAFNCPIWSDDKHFKKQKRIKVLTTKEILGIL